MPPNMLRSFVSVQCVIAAWASSQSGPNDLQQVTVDASGAMIVRRHGEDEDSLDNNDMENDIRDAGLTSMTSLISDATSVCSDDPVGWKDAEGYSCEEYVEGKWCNANGENGEGWVATFATIRGYAVDNISAFDACCGCGGAGNKIDCVMEVPSDKSSCTSTGEFLCNSIDYVVATPRSGSGAECVGQKYKCRGGDGSCPTSMCVDTPGWEDNKTWTCDDYFEKDYCTPTGGYGVGWASKWAEFHHFAVDGVSADDACCYCGGGSTKKHCVEEVPSDKSVCDASCKRIPYDVTTKPSGTGDACKEMYQCKAGDGTCVPTTVCEALTPTGTCTNGDADGEFQPVPGYPAENMGKVSDPTECATACQRADPRGAEKGCCGMKDDGSCWYFPAAEASCCWSAEFASSSCTIPQGVAAAPSPVPSPPSPTEAPTTAEPRTDDIHWGEPEKGDPWTAPWTIFLLVLFVVMTCTALVGCMVIASRSQE